MANELQTQQPAPASFIRPGEELAWQSLTTAFQTDLAPTGPLEDFLVTEITRAAWRIRRCNEMENAASAESSLDRSRVQAERTIERSLAELRRLQARRKKAPVAPANPFEREMARFAEITKRSQSKTAAPPAPPTVAPPAAHPRSETTTARNAPCPCGSGQKHKRCCGTNAPAILSRAA